MWFASFCGQQYSLKLVGCSNDFFWAKWVSWSDFGKKTPSNFCSENWYGKGGGGGLFKDGKEKALKQTLPTIAMFKI